MSEPMIYCFSATGNSMRTAQIIQEEIGGTICRITNHTPLQCNSVVIGFVFPTFYLGVPGMVRNFVSRLIIKRPDAYLFAVTTCGKICGQSIGQIEEILESRDHKLIYGGVVYAVANYICEYNIAVSKIEKDLTRAADQSQRIALEIGARQETDTTKWTVASKLFHQLYRTKYPSQDTHFWTNDACVGCGVCAKVCPASNILIEDKRPCFKGTCENCLACIHWCPTKALQWKKRTLHRERYHHPQVTLHELNG